MAATRLKPLCINRLAFGYKRTLDHLRAWPFVLPRVVKEAVVYLGLKGDQKSGTWLFVFENIPQLKYHNPNVQFSVTRHEGEDSKISFILEMFVPDLLLYPTEDGQCQTLETTHLRQQTIQEKVMEQNFEQPNS